MAKKRAAVVVHEPEDFDVEEQPLIDDGLTDNARDVPMFADIDGRTSRSISFLRLSKLEAGGPLAYKGMIPLNSTLDSIGQVYGDGIYTIEGLNHKHTVLATKDNIRISLTTVQGQESKQLALPMAGSTESDRIERLSLRAAEESKQLSNNFTTLVVETLHAATERERSWYAASRERDSQMFSNLLSLQEAGFRQTIAMMSSSHNQTIEKLSAVGSPKDKGSSSEMVEVLLRGLQMGRELSEGNSQEERPAWEQILTSGLGLLGSTKQLGVVAAAPTAAPAQPAPASLSPAAKRELKDAVRLLRTIRAKGIDPRELLVRLSEVGTPAPTGDEVEDTEDDDSDDIPPAEESTSEQGHYSA